MLTGDSHSPLDAKPRIQAFVSIAHVQLPRIAGEELLLLAKHIHHHSRVRVCLQYENLFLLRDAERERGYALPIVAEAQRHPPYSLEGHQYVYRVEHMPLTDLLEAQGELTQKTGGRLSLHRVPHGSTA